MNTLKKNLLIWILALGVFCDGWSQLVCVNCEGRDTTHYTNGYANDSLYFTCSGQTATLKADVGNGGLYNYQWYRFIAASNSWQSTVLSSQVATSIYNATIGGYRVVSTDAAGAIQMDETCWVSRINNPPIINANTLQPGCSQINLAAVYFPSNITAYYNPPPFNLDLPYVIDGTTEIQLCLDIYHPTLTDVSLQLVGPPECGSPVVLLTPSQTPLSQDIVCYNSDAVDLCFSNNTGANFDLCALPSVNVTGDFGAYGNPSTAIDWSALNGCEANQSGWQLVVGDCLEGALGQVTALDFTISGTGSDGLPVALHFRSGSTLPVNIADNQCSLPNATAINLNLLPQTAQQLGNLFSVMWSATPPIAAVNGQSAMNLYLNPGPTVDTYFTIELLGPRIGNACGAYIQDTEFFDYIQPDSTILNVADDILCLTDSALFISSSISEGVWHGPVQAVDGGVVLDPAFAGVGEWVISYKPNSYCIDSSAVTILIEQAPTIQITPLTAFCESDEPVVLAASPAGGVWLGDAILDATSGLFAPQSVVGSFAQVTYTSVGNCPASDTMLVFVNAFAEAAILESDTTVCLSSPPLNLDANLSPGTWSGTGITAAAQGIFNPSQVAISEHTIVFHYTGACETTDTIRISIDNPAIAFAEVPHVCVDSDPLQLIAVADSGVWSGIGIYDSVEGVVLPTLLSPGTHYFVYTLLNACASRDSLPLVVEDFPAIHLTLPDGLCADAGPILIEASINGGSFSGEGMDALMNGIFQPAVAGPGNAVINYHFEGICLVDVTDSLEVYPLPLIQAFTDTSICPEGQAILSATGGVSYMWFPGNNITNPLLPLVVVHPEFTTEYMVVGQSEQGCDAQAAVTVTVLPSPVVSTNGPLEICLGETEVLEAAGLESVQWSGAELSNPDQLITEVAPLQTGLYTVSGYDSLGCFGVATTEVVVNAPAAYFEASDTIGIPPLMVDFTNLSNADYFVWNLGNGDSVVTSNPAEFISTYYTGAHTFTVTLTAYLNGCPALYSNEIITYYDSELLLVPNIVTNNGDGKNDVWEIKTQNMDELHVDIFNRWGRKVGTLERPDDRWNPKNEGEGTYYYLLNALGLDQERYYVEGYFTVLQGEK